MFATCKETRVSVITRRIIFFIKKMIGNRWISALEISFSFFPPVPSVNFFGLGSSVTSKTISFHILFLSQTVAVQLGIILH